MPQKSCTHTINEFPFGDELIEVTLAVEFEVEPPDPSVGIFGCSIGGFDAKVVGARGDNPINAASFQLIQAAFDAAEPVYRDEIDATCLKSLDEDLDWG